MYPVYSQLLFLSRVGRPWPRFTVWYMLSTLTISSLGKLEGEKENREDVLVMDISTYRSVGLKRIVPISADIRILETQTDIFSKRISVLRFQPPVFLFLNWRCRRNLRWRNKDVRSVAVTCHGPRGQSISGLLMSATASVCGLLVL